MIPVKIQGEGNGVALLRDNALLVSTLPYPPADIPNKILPFSKFLTVNGDEVTTDLRVSGTLASPIELYVGPPNTGDIYLTSANILVSDSTIVTLNRFGGINGGLANGLTFFIDTENERYILAEGLKTNFDLIRLGASTPATGGKNDAYLLANTNSDNEDGYNPILDFTKISPVGMKMRRGTLDRLGVIVTDDLTSLGTFNILVNGFIRIP